MVSIMDDVVGNLTDALKAKGMWDNLFIAFSSDNGGPVDLQENAANNWPLRGGKWPMLSHFKCVVLVLVLVVLVLVSLPFQRWYAHITHFTLASLRYEQGNILCLKEEFVQPRSFQEE